MSKNKINQPFIDIKDKIKWEKLFNYINSYQYDKIKKINKKIFNNATIKNKKKLLVFLLAFYFENDLKNLELINNRINSFEKLSNKKEKIDFKKFIFKNKLINEKVQNKEKKVEDYVELYINIGKDKKVFPRDLVNFIINSMKIKSYQIRNIKIFDKYSFFQIPKDFGDKAIVLLSVKKFRGKNIIVNHSKNKS